MANFFETLMIVCFGASWPASIAKSYLARTTQGKSLLFLCLLALGYICGITAKLISHTYNLAFWFYFPNLTMISIDIGLYWRNRNLEKKTEKHRRSE